jgi:hypothetical protein
MRKVALLLVALLLAGCGAAKHEAEKKQPPPSPPAPPAAQKPKPSCEPGTRSPVGSARRAYVGAAPNGALARRSPSAGAVVVARFGPKNVNGYPTMFGVIGKVVDARCRPTWYEVQLPVRPNGATGYVRAPVLHLEAVTAHIEVDVSARTLTLYRSGRPVFTATVAVGSSATPTPTGRYYVNQRLLPDDPDGPYGPAAIGISAFSPVLTGWAQGGPVAIHGTNEPWSIGHAVSNGCIRLPNATLERLFGVAVAGTPVIIRA